MVRVRSLRKFWWCVVAAPLLAACGGSAVTPGPASAGAPGAGGETAAGGAAAAGGAGSCIYQGKSYAAGARFPASDGCNSCSCEANGSVGCTEIGCQNECGTLQSQYAAALERAKKCNPKSHSLRCQATAAATLPCGCSTPVDASNTEAISELSALSEQANGACGEALCAPCVPPRPGTCSEAGRCEDAPYSEEPAKAACKVGDVVYPNGFTGVPDLDGCNTCTCSDGQLSACTKVGCPNTCPTDTARGTQCAQCGPTDACVTVETACLPTCTDTCSNGGVCSNGLCRYLCG